MNEFNSMQDIIIVSVTLWMVNGVDELLYADLCFFGFALVCITCLGLVVWYSIKDRIH